MPVYQHAAYGGETVTLQNGHLKLDLHKRSTGWGWGELFNATGECVAILDHLGELMVRDQDVPMRLEAQEVRRESGDFGERLVLDVQSLVVAKLLRGTSFAPWIGYPLDEPCLEGQVTITLPPNEPVLFLSYELVSLANQYARYIRGPWVKVGEGTFGAAKDDGILPGVEWMIGDEWSSGTDWFKDPWALRVVPHPNKVGIPLMAISHSGTGIGLAWDPNRDVTGWFNYPRHHAQPLFASPNFVDRRNNHLLGLMVPEVHTEAEENRVYAEPPLELHLKQRVNFQAELFLVNGGNSLDVVVEWVKRHGLPEPQPRWPIPEALDRIAAAYNGHLWHEGQGFGTQQHGGPIRPHVPRFTEGYIARNPDSPLAKGLAEKVAWCKQHGGEPGGRRDHVRGTESLEEQRQRVEKLLSYQREDGSFPFDPDGRHYVKDDFVVARTFLEPMGLGGDTALDMSILPAMQLLALAETTRDQALAAQATTAARKALDYCLPMQRPEGGDFWETPLHSPNLLAAGHAAVAYYLGYRAFGDERYRAKAIHWIRSLLPFTHLWEPAGLPMAYNTKPCLCSSDWYFANWVRDHVQWEVLETFSLSLQHGIEWASIDPEIDWNRYHEGVTVAALRWMLDHTDGKWLPHNLPDTLELYRQGLMDCCFADTHNTVSGNYGGMGIMPDAIAVNLLGILERKEREA